MSNNMDTLLNPALEIAGSSKPSPRDDRVIRYLESLRREKDEWETFYKKSRQKKRKLLHQKERGQNTRCVPKPKEEMLAMLSEEDRSFLAKRPDYVGFGRLLESVWKQRLSVLELKDKVDHSYRIIEEQCEVFREKLVAHILCDKSK